MADGKLKPGWTRVAFGDVVRQVKDRVDPAAAGLERYVAGEHMDTDDLRLRRWGTVGDGYLGPAFHARFRPGQVLYGSRRTYLRKVAVPDFEGVTANTTFVIETRDPNVLLPELLPFIMQTEAFHEHSIKKSKGSVNPYVNFSDIAAWEFALPPPTEQRRMAVTSAAATQAVERLRVLADHLRRIQLGMVQRTVDLARHARSLVSTLLREPPRNGLSLAADSDDSLGRPVTVSISAVNQRGLFEPGGCTKSAPVDIETVRRFLVRRDDVFVVRGNGNRALCGRAGLSERSHENLFYPDLLIRLRFDEARILPDFATSQWNLPSVHRRLNARAKSTNGTWKVNGQDVRAHELAVPSLGEQRTVVDNLRRLRETVNAVHLRMAPVLEVKTTLLHQLGSPRLVDFEDLERNQYVVTTQYTVRSGANERRLDLVLLVNGVPLVVIEAKTPVRSSESWFDGATQVHDDYERNVPELFVPNVCSAATEGKELHYGSIGLPVDKWGPWRTEGDADAPTLERIRRTVASMLRPQTVLDLLGSFTAYVAGKGKRLAKIVARYQQVEAANRIVARVVAGHPRKGLVWHFQGSGKSLLMLFAARKLRLHPALGNPTVLVVVDRVDLDTQISGTFHAAGAANLEKANRRTDLERLLAQDARKIIITTIFKFGEAEGVLNDRGNVIALVDEAHRSQEGDLGRKMRRALPNAFLFGLTGTPINRADRNTFFAFGAEEDEYGYLSRYGFEESIRDGATLPLHFEPRLPEVRIDRDAIDAEYAELTGGLSDLDREQLSKTAARTAVLLKAPKRVERICADIAEHFQQRVAPHGFGAQVVAWDREGCALYKRALDRVLPAERSDVVMTVDGDEEEYAAWRRDRDAEERLLDRFRDPADPLKILIVTSKLLTGFDAPILQAMYLDKPLRDHALLQAICRTNRPYGKAKTHGLIVDYLGVFDDVAQAIQFDEQGVKQVVTNLHELAAAVPAAVQKCLARFPGVDRAVAGYEGLIAAQECLPDNEARDGFAADYSYLARLWEAVSPRLSLEPFETDYRWLSQVYESVKPSSGAGKLLWQALGAQTLDLIQRNVDVDAVRDDLDTLVLDAEVLEAVLGAPDPDRKSKEIEIQVAARLRNHLHDPRFRALGERLEALRQKHEQGLLVSVEFLKSLLELARDVVEAEKTVEPATPEERGRAALTELFEEARNERTPILVARVVKDIDEIVRHVRFPGWQKTHAGEREVKKALRKTLFKYRLHQEQDLFDRAFGYIRQYY